VQSLTVGIWCATAEVQSRRSGECVYHGLDTRCDTSSSDNQSRLIAYPLLNVRSATPLSAFDISGRFLMDHRLHAQRQHYYGETEVRAPITLDIPVGADAAIVGPSAVASRPCADLLAGLEQPGCGTGRCSTGTPACRLLTNPSDLVQDFAWLARCARVRGKWRWCLRITGWTPRSAEPESRRKSDERDQSRTEICRILCPRQLRSRMKNSTWPSAAPWRLKPCGRGTEPPRAGQPDAANCDGRSSELWTRPALSPAV